MPSGPEIGVRLWADTGEFARDLGKAAHLSERQLMRIAAAGAAAGTMVAAGLVASARALASFVADAVETRAALDDLADTTGDSVRQLDALRREAIVSGTSFETMSTALAKLAKTLQTTEGAKALEALGLSAETLRQKKPAEALLDIARAMVEYADSGDKAAVAQMLFGKSGAELLPFLKDLAEAGELTGKVSAEQAVQAERLEKEWRRLSLAARDLRDDIADYAIPALADFAEEIDRTLKKSGWLGTLLIWTRDIGRLFRTPGEQLRSTIEEIDQLEKKLKAMDVAGVATDSGARKQLEMTLAFRRHYAEYLGLLRAQELRRTPIDVPEPTMGGRKRLIAPVAKDAGALEEEKRFISALQSLEKQYASLTHESQTAITVFETEKGSLRDLTAAHKAQLLVKAQQIDAYRADVALRQMLIAGLEAQIRAEEKARAIVEDSLLAGRDELDQLRHERSLLGLTAREQEKLNAMRRIELDLRRKVAALPMDEEGNFIGNAGEQLAALRTLAEKHKAAVLGMIDERQAAERAWLHGARRGFDDYVALVENRSAQVAALIANAFSHSEDALVQFVRTGKLEFRGLADAILTDMARIAVRQGITGPIAEGFGGAIAEGLGAALGSLFGGSFAKGTDYVPRDMLAIVHKGERIVPADENRRMRAAAAAPLAGTSHAAIGRAARPTLMAQPAVHVPSYASGTSYVPRTGLAVLHQGERVVPVHENRRGAAADGGSGNVMLFNIDARGADRVGLARVEGLIKQLGGSIEYIAIDAVRRHLATRGIRLP